MPTSYCLTPIPGSTRIPEQTACSSFLQRQLTTTRLILEVFCGRERKKLKVEVAVELNRKKARTAAPVTDISRETVVKLTRQTATCSHRNAVEVPKKQQEMSLGTDSGQL
jgi:hypothetical protein